MAGVLLLTGTPALAHARLETADPPAGAVLTAAPREIRLSLTEQISPQFSVIRVQNVAGQAVNLSDLSQPREDNHVVRISLPPDLPSGTYTVYWRVVSAVDGHVSAGGYPFTVQLPGSAPVATPAAAAGLGSSDTDSDSSPSPPPLRWFSRAVALIGGAGLLGGALFSSLVLGGGPPAVSPRLARLLGVRLARVTIGLAGAVALALVADMLYQVASLISSDLPGALGRLDLVGAVISDTGYGTYWALRVAAAAALLTYGAWRLRFPVGTDWSLAVGAAGLLLAGEALSSHEAAARPFVGLPLGMLGDLAHLLATAAWTGGLLYFAVVLLPALRAAGPGVAAPALGRIIPRFSRLALVSVAVLVVSGVANLAVHTLDPAVVAASDYGRLLIFKHLLFLPLLAVGALNRQVLRPRFVALATTPPPTPPLKGEGSRRATSSPALPLKGEGRTAVAPLLPAVVAVGGAESGLLARFGRAVGLEAALAVAVLCCAAGLTLLPPP
ncbi:MAG: copper resistance protein CopC [Chloroflexota bacterium]|nr:copper resistance protein CopC [Chloroflexota bacterium]